MAVIQHIWPWLQQPQEAVNVAQRFSAPIIFAHLPPVGGVNLATGVAPDGVGTITTEATPVGIAHRGGKYGYPTNISLANGATFISIWRAGTQYSGADGSRRIISNQKSGSNGFSWGRHSAIGGGSTGNLTSQRLTFHGVADYTEANATIESYVDTPVACRYNKATGTISWFRFGVQSSADTSASTSPPAGFATVIGGQGDFTSSSELWIDKASVVVVFGGALSDAEIFDLTNSVGAVWQAFADQAIPVPVSASGGPTDYPATTAESASAADACSVMIGFWSAAPEVGSAADTSSQVASLSAVATESTTAADTAGGTASGDYAASATETGSAVDTSNRTFGATEVIAEAGAASDSQSVIAALSKSVSESGSALDAQSVLAAFSKAAAESAAAVDATSNVTSLSRATTEATSALDTVNGTASGDFSGTVTEAGEALDASANVAGLSAVVSDAGVAADALLVVRAIAAAVAEALNIADAVSGVAAGDYAAAIAELASSTDVSSAQYAAVASVLEAASASDLIFTNGSAAGTVAEAAAALDAVAALLANTARGSLAGSRPVVGRRRAASESSGQRVGTNQSRRSRWGIG